MMMVTTTTTTRASWKTNQHVLVKQEARYSCIKRVTDRLPKLFSKDEPEQYMLFHQDLSGNYILVDEDHNISGIIDEECIHMVPFWVECQIPNFLRNQQVDGPLAHGTGFKEE